MGVCVTFAPVLAIGEEARITVLPASSPALAAGGLSSPDETQVAAAILQAIRDEEFIDSRWIDLLVRDREKFVSRLKVLFVENLDANPALALGAASVLLKMKDPSSAEYFARLEKSSDAAVRRQVLDELSFQHLADEFPAPLPPELQAKFIKALADPDAGVRAHAAWECAEIPSARARVFGLLDDLDGESQKRLIRRLADTGLSAKEAEELATRTLAFVQVQPLGKDTIETALDVLANVPRDAPSSSAGKLRKLVEDFLLESNDSYIFDQQMARSFAKAAATSSLPALERIRSKAKDPAAVEYAFVAIARLKGESVLPEALAFFEIPYGRGTAFNALAEIVNEGNRSQIVGEVIARSKKQPTTELVNFLIDHGGDEGRKYLRENAGKFSPENRMQIAWALNDLDPAAVFADLQRGGLIASLPAEKDVERYRAEWSELPRRRQNFEIGGQFIPQVSFDSETDEIPCRYDEVIREFAKGSGGVFQPTEIRQVEKPDGEEDLAYTVEFVCADKRFRFQPESSGDWLDLKTLQDVINLALETAGRPERFLTLDFEDQVAYFVFGDPKKWAEAAVRYALPLSFEGSRAAESGKDFENRAIEHLRKIQD